MNQRIIYQTNKGGVAVVVPANCGLTIEEIAAKDVPAGAPYRIVTTDDIPSDRTFREAWEADFSDPDGYGIGAEAYFAAKEAEQ